MLDSGHYKITKFTDDSTVSSLTFNKPLILILAALNNLRINLDSMTNKSAVIQYLGVLDTDVAVGDLVYYDSLTSSATYQSFKKAKAQLAAVPGTQGQSILAPSSRIEGLVLNTSPVQILRQGYYNAPLIILITLGSSSALPGLYYLSPLQPGKATLNPGWNMRQPCISYYGDGKFSLITNYLAHDSHHHASMIIPDTVDWNSGRFTITDMSFGCMSKLVTAVFVSGILSLSFTFSSDGYTLIYNGDPSDIQGKVITIFNHYPFAYGDSVVRSILTQSDNIDIKSKNGLYLINFKLPAAALTLVNKSFALFDIENNQKKYTPIVSNIRGASGINVTRHADGVFTISNASVEGARLVASDITCVGTQFVVDTLLTYLTFLASIDSSAIISIPINNISLALYSVKLWCVYRGGSSALLSTLYYWVPNTKGAIPTPNNLPISKIRLSGANTTLLYFVLDSTGFTFTPTLSGTIIIKLSKASDNNIASIYKCGCTLQLTNIIDSNSLSSNVDLLTIRLIALDVVSDYLTYNAKD